MRKLALPVLLIVALLMFGAACQSDEPSPTATPVPPTATPAPTATPESSDDVTPPISIGEVPEEFKDVASAMANVNSLKMKISVVTTIDGTPIPTDDMLGMSEITAEFDLANNRTHVMIGDLETITIGNVSYTKFGADAEWMMLEMEPGEAPEADFVPTDEDFAALGEIKDLGTESCDGTTCRVYSAVDLEDTEQGIIKFWIGESDNLMHKAVGEQVDDEGVVTTFTMEFFDYNQPVTIEAPIE